MTPLSLAIIEDEEAHFQLIKRSLEKQFPQAVINHFPDAHAFIANLHEVHSDLIIVDYLMPGMNGIQFLRTLNQEGIEIPVVMITGQGDENVAVQAIKMGAYDYLVKSNDFFVLIPGVVQKAIREKSLRDSMRKSARLNDLLLNSFPHPAMLIKRDRTVVAANRAAQEMGAKIGGICWRDFGKSGYVQEDQKNGQDNNPGGIPSLGTKCTFCLGDEALEQKKPKQAPELRAFGRIWDSWWIPIDDEIYFHYTMDVTDRKRAEENLRASENRLRILSAQLLRAQEDERKRIAGELHDSIGSGLTAVKMCLENAFSALHQGTADLESLGHATSMLQQLIEESRRIMNDLRPSLLDDLGIVKTISWFCRQFQMIHAGIRVERTVETAEEALPERVKIAVFRVIQEAFQNIAKHSKADSIHLSLVPVPVSGAIELTIEDNGIGFDLNAVPSRSAERIDEGGLGLTSMKERVELSGGSFMIESKPRRGTIIRAAWSLENLGPDRKDHRRH